MDLSIIAEARLVAQKRAENPMSRGTDIFRYTHNGSIRAVRSCRVCGASTSWCRKWPRTHRSYAFEFQHAAQHIADELSAMREE